MYRRIIEASFIFCFLFYLCTYELIFIVDITTNRVLFQILLCFPFIISLPATSRNINLVYNAYILVGAMAHLIVELLLDYQAFFGL